MEAYARTLIAGQERRVFFVPATINYLITLEAETLIDDFLSEEGKGRFIIDDDESTRLARVGVLHEEAARHARRGRHPLLASRSIRSATASTTTASPTTRAAAPSTPRATSRTPAAR